MKKTIILFLLFTAANSYGQYFGEKITYLVKNEYSGRHLKTGVYDLELVSHNTQKTIYNFREYDSYVEIHNDSIFCIAAGDKRLMFHAKLDVGDSITYLEHFGMETKIIVDSIVELNNRNHFYYRFYRDVNHEYYINLIWIEGIGELHLGIDFENGIFDGISHHNDTFLAYCIDGQPYYMNGDIWEADDDCSFENSKLGISKLKDTQKQFTLSPNPSQGVFQIANNNAPIGVEGITIYDLQGKIIFQENTSQYLTEKTIDLFEFPPSMYQLIIQRTDGMIESHKIIKQ